MIARSILAITALIAVAPLAAQSSPAQTDPAHQAADAREVPETRALNDKVGSAIAQTQTNNAVAQAQNEENQAQYEADKAAYAAALRQHNREVLENDATFIRQREAYAMAMRDWRAQVAMCKRGYQSACKLPTPDPMNYM
ncbi:hypothetical protein [Rhizorhabdus wittichii]|jgi:hypothetical protein|uniref:Cell wall hydrolase n=1 Tax=Rhizorhabdus wittichii (strain DSM 6014 / CCUG 31198 / JCM 15750 / NBRC 105917 / EY 4224 / RW1) TaxID=392499 RepID=A0A9J9H7X0_RHIWR|nr:hypothetical protein [Rhizorhabdus wittichii]ABQ66610.1 hypothetical protein Swit_0239 [Rhizorhabdus wittichii RW1]ARR56819.1 hypothetical protein HY78_26960 [Rhizorhabdus wittichii DC-6]